MQYSITEVFIALHRTCCREYLQSSVTYKFKFYISRTGGQKSRVYVGCVSDSVTHTKTEMFLPQISIDLYPYTLVYLPNNNLKPQNF
ncbi:hypothetical protein FDUTEX481_05622 [Tolypothrix sp. PCC 7601]|nr:hypothetical protein FDUTEX481_05622 [Tolypothrix sp. PCC 7601]BAY94465.1 hypothetical protein NIES3275_65130 [Microchaete diplosiphon NIES-3275]